MQKREKLPQMVAGLGEFAGIDRACKNDARKGNCRQDSTLHPLLCWRLVDAIWKLCKKNARLDPGWNEAKARPQARLLDIENQLATNKFEQIFAPHYDGIYMFIYIYIFNIYIFFD